MSAGLLFRGTSVSWTAIYIVLAHNTVVRRADGKTQTRPLLIMSLGRLEATTQPSLALSLETNRTPASQPASRSRNK